MDDLSEKISQLLSDPAGMERVKEMAGQLLGQNDPKPSEDVLPGIDMGMVMSLLQKMRQSGSSERERLLLALRPHLHAERQQRLDTAVRLLRLLDLAPLLKESGLLGPEGLKL